MSMSTVRIWIEQVVIFKIRILKISLSIKLNWIELLQPYRLRSNISKELCLFVQVYSNASIKIQVIGF